MLERQCSLLLDVRKAHTCIHSEHNPPPTGKGETPSVDRFCSLTNQATECVASAPSSSSSYECYCNGDYCDALLAEPDMCDAAASIVSSFALVLAPAALLSVLSLAG